MSARLIIGIGHKARHGKDTAAEYLRSKYGCAIIHFADALYEECQNAEILLTEEPPALYLKPRGEDYFRYPDPPEPLIEWMRSKGERRRGLPFRAGLYYGGMNNKDGTLLQFWGTEFRRKNCGWDYWVDKVRTALEADRDSDFLVPDTRFRNEARMIRDMGGLVWKIDRTGYVAEDRDPRHTSEIDLDGWQFDDVILNDGTIADLYEKVDARYRRLKGIM